MKILIDADACPVVKLVEEVAEKNGISCLLLCDTNHVLTSDYSEVAVIGAGADAVDYALVNRLCPGDVVVTQDYGLAAMVLSRRAYAIHQNGRVYTDDNMEQLLAARYESARVRRSSAKHHIKGPKKRTREDDQRFQKAFISLLNRAMFMAPIWEAADPAYQQFHQGLCPGKDNIIGVRMPKLRQIAKEYNGKCQFRYQQWLQEEKTAKRKPDAETKQAKLCRIYDEYMAQFQFVYAEETMIYGYMIGGMKADYEVRLRYLPTYVSHIDSWAVCDSPVSSMKWITKNRPEFWQYLQEQYGNSQKEYELRFMIVVLLDHYITQEYLEQVLAWLDTVHLDAYYVKMAVAWAVSVCYIKFPEKTMPFLKDNHLDDWTFHKALSKITDSYRVSKEEKERIRVMRRDAGKRNGQ